VEELVATLIQAEDGYLRERAQPDLGAARGELGLCVSARWRRG